MARPHISESCKDTSAPDVLLVNYIDKLLQEKIDAIANVENMGLLYVCASLRDSDFSCEILDSFLEDWTIESFADRIHDMNPSLYIGFSVESASFNGTHEVIRKIRRKGMDVFITLGGKWASLRHEDILAECKEIDSVVVGEAEETAVDLAHAIRLKKQWRSIAGIASRSGNGIVKFTPRRVVDNIDSIPEPDRSCYASRIKKKGVQSILFSRGCAGRCRFCSVSSYLNTREGKRRRVRNPVKVVDEMARALRETGIAKFSFTDLDFIGFGKDDHHRCYLLAKEIQRRGLPIRFGIETQAKGVEAGLLSALKDAGLSQVHLGIESWADSQLKRYGKASTRKDNLRAVEILEKLNIPFFTYLIPIDPYVSRSELMINIKEIEQVGVNRVIEVDFCKKLSLHQESPFYHRCKSDGLIKHHDKEALNDPGVSFYQFHRDVKIIADLALEIRQCYEKSSLLLRKTTREKCLPLLWETFCRETLEVLQKMLFDRFKECVVNPHHFVGMENVISSEINNLYRQVAKLCASVSREGLENNPSLTILLDGEEVSTKLKESYVIPLRR
jgi:anaerobic magnesium-protoporphyrin IX monomethyl ester cyclase